MVPGHGWLAGPYGTHVDGSPGSRDRVREIKLDKVSSGVVAVEKLHRRIHRRRWSHREEAKRILVSPVPGPKQSPGLRALLLLLPVTACSLLTGTTYDEFRRGTGLATP